MTGDSQLPLDLGLRPALGREDFLLGPCNEVAVAWIDRWPDWPGVALALHGPAACGKTHLAGVWRARSTAIEVAVSTLAQSDAPALLGSAQAYVLEDLDAALAAGRVPEYRLLHFYNLVAEHGGHILMTGQTPPARWPVELADLRSRLRAAPVVAMAPPDDALIEAVLVKLFADRQLRVEAGLVRYLAARMERSFAAARDIVAAMDRVALADRREITIPLARQVLAAQMAASVET